MNVKKWIAIAGAAMLFPLSSVFAQNAERGPAPAPAKISAAFNKTAKAHKPVHWLDEQGVPAENARTLLRYLEGSSAHGLNPSVYDVKNISRLMKSDDHGDLENLLTQALVRYVRDMTGPRVDPAVVDSRDWYWRRPLGKEKIMARYAGAPDLDAKLEALAPKDPLYGALQEELQRLSHAAVTRANTGRIEQVVANLERMRWDMNRPSRYVEVNIANQTLNLVDNGEVVDSIDIIVGRVDPDTQTREFTTKITGVRFNPTWFVPAELMIRDKIPLLKKDSYSLEREEIFVFRDGKRIDPGVIDWKNITGEQLSHLSMKQPPGDVYNRLGYFRALMEDPYDQYMHYTNEPKLFRQAERAFSSGCMRVKDPDKLVGFIMSMTAEEIDRRKNDGRSNIDVKAPEPLTFFSVYRSVTLDADGKLHYHRDIYNRDKALFAALKEQKLTPPMPEKHKKKPLPKKDR